MQPGVTNRRYVQNQTALAPFPLRWNARLTYGVNVALGTAGNSSLASAHYFRLNSAYDFDFTGTGEQPYQYDQMTAIYKKYLVTAVTVDLTISDPSSDGLWVGWSLRPNSNTGDDPANKTLGDIMSRPTFRCVPLNNTGSQIVTIRERIPIHTIFGLSAQQYKSAFLDYGADWNSNPANVAFLSLFVIDPNSLLSPQYVRFAGRAVFEIQFFDYTAPSGS